MCRGISKYGFGFDELSDYKVFVLINRINTGGLPISCIGLVYRLMSNSWKNIGECDISPFETEGMGMYVSGKLHWCRFEGYKCDIISFDLNRHVYGVVELPSYMEGDLYSLGVLGGCLSAHFCNPNGGLDVWLMKEYGVKKSWDKVATVPKYNHPDCCETPTPLVIAPDGEVLLFYYYSSIVIYNPKCDVFRHHKITGLDDESFNILDPFVIYIESLASVAPDAQQER
ncbi:hypothetical protein ACS0TY_017782 [Phlomoides rotata]